jgi:alanyl aminopeptidase
LLAAAKVEQDRADRGRLIGATAETNDRALVSEQLPLVLTDTFDTREGMRLLWTSAGDYRTRDLALEFLKTNWDTLITKLPKDGGANLVWMAGSFCDEKSRDEARTFFDGRSTKYLGGPRTFALAMESIDLCIAWRARQRDSAISFFKGMK